MGKISGRHRESNSTKAERRRQVPSVKSSIQLRGRLLSYVRFFVTLWTVARQALSMGFPRQEYWSGLPFPPPGDLSDPGVEPVPPVWQANSLPLSHLGSPPYLDTTPKKIFQLMTLKEVSKHAIQANFILSTK